MTAPFIEALAKVVDDNGNEPALVDQGTTCYDYSSLWHESGALAANLRAAGLSPGDVVGLHMPKSPRYVVAMLAVWRADGAFLPMDPALPNDRLALMAHEARAALLLNGKGEIVSVNEGLGAAAPLSLRRLDSKADCTHSELLAYIIYTSGSSGQPKGVRVTHQGLLSMLRAQIQAFHLRPGDRSLFYLSTNFDASISDIGTALLSGAALFFEAETDLLPGPGFIALLKTRGITYADLPPAILPFLQPEHLPDHLHTIAFGGETCDPTIVAAHSEHRRMVCVYGPTEATICTSLCLVENWTQPLIGAPLPGVSYVVRDSKDSDLPDGTPGELHIAGDCLAAGYLDRPEQEQRRFFHKDGRRWYRSGDFVCREGDTIRFLGRQDRFVKINGKAVALEEVERCLAAHPTVGRCAVVNKDRLLVAWIQTRSQVDEAAIRRYLRQRLPAWMVPTRIRFCIRLPLTSSGKVDLNNLQNRNPDPEDGQSILTAGSSEIHRLATIWGRALGRNLTEPHDHFYDLGGDSLVAVRIAANAARAGLDVSPADILQYPTFAQLNEQVSSREKQSPAPPSDGMLIADLRRIALNRRPPYPPPKPPASRSNTLLLTGATGFLGSAILAALLRNSEAEILCTVRAANTANATQRLATALQDWGLEPDSLLHERVQAIPADLEQPRMGLNLTRWRELTQRVGSIFHVAANINALAPFQALEAVNVGGAATILDLANEGTLKPIHHASSLAVLLASDANVQDFSEFVLSPTHRVFGGYAQSKIVAEYLLASRHNTGIYRFGLIGPSRTGHILDRGLFRHFLEAVRILKCLPDHPASDAAINLLPVDQAAEAFTKVAMAGFHGIRHLAYGCTFTPRNIACALSNAGIPIAFVNPREFQETRTAILGVPGRTMDQELMFRISGFLGHRYQARDPLNPLQTTGLTLARPTLKANQPNFLEPSAYLAGILRRLLRTGVTV